MRIAHLAIDDLTNYGNFLQKYALHKTLKKFSDDVEIFWYQPNTFWIETGYAPPPPEHIRDKYPLDYQRWYFYEAVRIAKIKDFSNRYIKTRYNIPYAEEIADEYDFFVIGSDQVWRPLNWVPLEWRFLPFVPREKRIAYAASIGVSEIPEDQKELYRQGIGGFDYVSVREEDAVQIIENLGLKKPLHVLDPVLLLTIDEWKQIARQPSWFNEKYSRGYIFTYLFDDVKFPAVNELSKKMNLPVVNMLDLNNFNHYTTSPEEFIYLIANSTAVFTNSFHGTAFSILFKRPFWVYGETENSMSRKTSILKMFGLENRIAKPQDNYSVESLLEIDFSVRDKILPYERAKAFKFLTNALSENNLNRGGY